MKIMLMGEGPTDVGRRIYGTNGFEKGLVAVLFERILGKEQVEFQLLYRSDRKAEDRQQKRHSFHVQRSLKKLPGLGTPALWAKRKAVEEGADVIAFYSDSDTDSSIGKKSEQACHKRYDEVKEEIRNGFDACDRLFPNQVKDIYVIPVKMIESWLMGDPTAFPAAFGKARGKNVTALFPDKPELAWGGQRDPESNYPKNQLNRILRCFRQTAGLGTFVAIAEEMDFAALCRSCPISFREFYEKTRGLHKA